MNGLAVDDGFAAEPFFQQLDEIGKPHSLGFAQVEDLITEFLLRASQDAIDGVRDVSVIAGRAPVTKDRDRFPLGHELGKLVDRQVRSLARPIDGEEPEHDHIHPVDVVVNMAERLAGQLAGGVGRNGRKNRVRLREGNPGVDAIDRGGRSDGDFFDAVEPRGFQQVDRAFDVHALIKRRFRQAGAHAGAGGKVGDLIELHTAQQGIDGRPVGQISPHEAKAVFGGGERLHVALFDGEIVERIQIIECPDRVALAQQALAHVRADEARPARDQVIHERTLTLPIADCQLPIANCRLPIADCRLSNWRLRRVESVERLVRRLTENRESNSEGLTCNNPCDRNKGVSPRNKGVSPGYCRIYALGLPR